MQGFYRAQASKKSGKGEDSETSCFKSQENRKKTEGKEESAWLKKIEKSRGRKKKRRKMKRGAVKHLSGLPG